MSAPEKPAVPEVAGETIRANAAEFSLRVARWDLGFERGRVERRQETIDELRTLLESDEAQLAAVRAVVERLGNSFERTSMYMEEEQRTGKATALSITRMSARKAALEQVLEELRAALSHPSPSAVPGEKP